MLVISYMFHRDYIIFRCLLHKIHIIMKILLPFIHVKCFYLSSYSESPFFLTHELILFLVRYSLTHLSLSLFMFQLRTLGPYQLSLPSCKMSTCFSINFLLGFVTRTLGFPNWFYCLRWNSFTFHYIMNHHFCWPTDRYIY